MNNMAVQFGKMIPINSITFNGKPIDPSSCKGSSLIDTLQDVLYKIDKKNAKLLPGIRDHLKKIDPILEEKPYIAIHWAQNKPSLWAKTKTSLFLATGDNALPDIALENLITKHLPRLKQKYGAHPMWTIVADQLTNLQYQIMNKFDSKDVTVKRVNIHLTGPMPKDVLKEILGDKVKISNITIT